ncbi:MAG: universal stress protein [Hyphomicrobiaceae bacterium]
MNSILVHLNAYIDWTPSIDAAIGLARKLEAKLTGLFTTRELAMLKLMLHDDHPAVREAESRDAVQIDKARARFLEACADAGLKSEFDVGEGDAHELLCLAGRCHDLVVIEHSRTGFDRIGNDSAEECAIACGTPTVIVPRTGDFAEIGQCIVVAWNNSRQAAAAVHGALPLISRADKVVAVIGEDRDAMPSVTRRPRTDLAEYLGYYNTNVEVVPFTDQAGNTGLSLQETARRLGGDMLVMGAYGRPSWRQLIFGGTTQEVMSELSLPVLMAH